MTAAGPQGYPDYVRAPQVALSPLINQSGIDLSTGFTLGPFYVGNAGSLVVNGRLGDASAGMGSTWAYSDDEAGSIVTGQYTIVYDKDGTDFFISDAVPVLGNFLTATYPALSLANLTISVTPLCIAVPGVRALPNERIAYGTDPSVTSGGTLVANSLFTCACMATVYGASNMTPWSLLAEAEDGTGTWFPIGGASFGTGVTDGQVDVPLPRAPVRVTAINQNAGDAAMQVALTAHMR
jgi:hypothetical protein